jgi:hypothetical protein
MTLTIRLQQLLARLTARQTWLRARGVAVFPTKPKPPQKAPKR